MMWQIPDPNLQPQNNGSNRGGTSSLDGVVLSSEWDHSITSYLPTANKKFSNMIKRI